MMLQLLNIEEEEEQGCSLTNGDFSWQNFDYDESFWSSEAPGDNVSAASRASAAPCDASAQAHPSLTDRFASTTSDLDGLCDATPADEKVLGAQEECIVPKQQRLPGDPNDEERSAGAGAAPAQASKWTQTDSPAQLEESSAIVPREPKLADLIRCSFCTNVFNRTLVCQGYLLQLNRPIQCACGCVLCTVCYRTHRGCAHHNLLSAHGPVNVTANRLASCPELQSEGTWDLERDDSDLFLRETETHDFVRTLVTDCSPTSLQLKRGG